MDGRSRAGKSANGQRASMGRESAASMWAVWAALVILALAVSPFTRLGAHNPAAAINQVVALAQQAGQHGHAHADREDMFQALHGHALDLADHDHAQAVPLTPPPADTDTPVALAWRAVHDAAPPGPVEAADRPPRA